MGYRSIAAISTDIYLTAGFDTAPQIQRQRHQLTISYFSHADYDKPLLLAAVLCWKISDMEAITPLLAPVSCDAIGRRTGRRHRLQHFCFFFDVFTNKATLACRLQPLLQSVDSDKFCSGWSPFIREHYAIACAVPEAFRLLLE